MMMFLHVFLEFLVTRLHGIPAMIVKMLLASILNLLYIFSVITMIVTMLFGQNPFPQLVHTILVCILTSKQKP